MESNYSGALKVKQRVITWSQTGERFEIRVTRRAFESVWRAWFVEDFARE